MYAMWPLAWASMMAVKDITAEGKIAASYVYNYVEAYIDVFVVYIISCTLAQFGFHLCEKHFGRYRQSAQSVGK